MEDKYKVGWVDFPFSIFRFPLFLWLIFLSSAVYSQTISGIVTDQKNAPVQNAEITLTNQAKTTTIAQTKTGADGKFSIDLQNTQNSLMVVKAENFASFSKILPKG